jgi:hypothetical protein
VSVEFYLLENVRTYAYGITIHSSFIIIIIIIIIIICRPGSSVSIATGYGLDGPGIESRWGQDFLHLSRPALRPTQSPVQWVPGISRGLRVARA